VPGVSRFLILFRICLGCYPFMPEEMESSDHIGPYGDQLRRSGRPSWWRSGRPSWRRCGRWWNGCAPVRWTRPARCGVSRGPLPGTCDASAVESLVPMLRSGIPTPGRPRSLRYSISPSGTRGAQPSLHPSTMLVQGHQRGCSWIDEDLGEVLAGYVCCIIFVGGLGLSTDRWN
jgi:hypothetical protein